MIDISYLMSTFFPTYEVYEDWLDGKIVVVKMGADTYLFFTKEEIEEMKRCRKEYGCKKDEKLAERFGINASILRNLIGENDDDIQD